MIEALRAFIEKYSFGVCSYLGKKMGIRSSRVRLYFIYSSFVTMGSPIIIYLILAFWVNVKEYVRRSKSLIFD